MKLVIWTQYWENYGFAEGGEHWKPKGGDKYTLATLTIEEIMKLGSNGLACMAHALSIAQGKVWSNPASESTMIDWELE
jgi:hypothetical protein